MLHNNQISQQLTLESTNVTVLTLIELQYKFWKWHNLQRSFYWTFPLSRTWNTKRWPPNYDVMIWWRSPRLPILEVIRQHDSCNTGELDRHAQHQQPCLASRTLRVIRVYCPTRATCFIRDTLVFVRAPSDVSSFVLKAISNENRELSHTTPEAAKSTPEAATLATLILPINRRVTRVV